MVSTLHAHAPPQATSHNMNIARDWRRATTPRPTTDDHEQMKPKPLDFPFIWTNKMKHRFTFARSWIAAYLILSVGIGLISPIGASVACNETSTCAAALRPGSACVDGFCTNPFSKGCLNTILGDEYKIRTCNSEDGE